jgi:hypothetical protein
MPFCRATLSAKRFIAGAGGRATAAQLIAELSADGSQPAPPSLSLPMMR